MPSMESVESRPATCKRNRATVTSTTAATPGVTTRSRARAKQQKESQSAARDKTGELDGAGQPESSKKGKTVLELIRDSPSWEEDDEDDDRSTSSFSSAVSSPIRVPEPLDFRPHDPNGDSEVAEAKRAKSRAFYQKIERQNQLTTLFPDMPTNCLVNDLTLLHIREPARKTVLRAAQFVVGLSSSIDGVPLARCSGFLIDSDSENRTGTQG